MTNKSKFPVGCQVRHRLTGMEGEVRQVFGGKIWLQFCCPDGKIIRDWFHARGFEVIAGQPSPEAA